MNGKKTLYALYLAIIVLVIFAVSYLYCSVQNPPPQPVTVSPTVETITEEEPSPLRGLILKSESWTGDFDKMLETRRIRVLVPPSRPGLSGIYS